MKDNVSEILSEALKLPLKRVLPLQDHCLIALIR